MLDALLFLTKDESTACIDGSLLNIMRLVRLVIKVLQIAVPVGLVLMGTIDMAKSVIAGDEKKIKEAQKPFVKRIVAAIIVFLIPYIVNIAINLVVSDASDWRNCWNTAGKDDYNKINYNNDLKDANGE